MFSSCLLLLPHPPCVLLSLFSFSPLPLLPLSMQGHCSRGEELLRSLDHWSDLSTVGLQAYEARVQEFWTRLQDFSQRVQSTGGNIERSVRLYRFLDQVICSLRERERQTDWLIDWLAGGGAGCLCLLLVHSLNTQICSSLKSCWVLWWLTNRAKFV